MPRGDAHPNAKLTTVRVREIRHRYLYGSETLSVIAQAYGVSQSTLNAVISGRSWHDPAYVVPSKEWRLQRTAASAGMAKLNWKAVGRIRKLFAAGKASRDELAARYGVSQPTISKVLRNDIWRDRAYTPPARLPSMTDRVFAPMTAEQAVQVSEAARDLPVTTLPLRP